MKFMGTIPRFEAYYCMKRKMVEMVFVVRGLYVQRCG
jgi:hypothetical protein